MAWVVAPQTHLLIRQICMMHTNYIIHTYYSPPAPTCIACSRKPHAGARLVSESAALRQKRSASPFPLRSSDSPSESPVSRPSLRFPVRASGSPSEFPVPVRVSSSHPSLRLSVRVSGCPTESPAGASESFGTQKSVDGPERPGRPGRPRARALQTRKPL